MRTIKFRCWDEEQKKMILDGCVRESDAWGEGSEFITICLSGAIDLQTDDDGGKNGRHEHSVSFKNGRFKLMQFTGLTDKNGVEIFEGDIVLAETDWNFGTADIVGKVVYQREKAVYVIEGFIADENRSFHVFDCWRPEVIGNIYENPELLKEGAE